MANAPLSVTTVVAVLFSGCMGASGPAQQTSDLCAARYVVVFFVSGKLIGDIDEANSDSPLRELGLHTRWDGGNVGFTYGDAWDATVQQHRGLLRPLGDDLLELLVWREEGRERAPLEEERPSFDPDVRTAYNTTLHRLVDAGIGRPENSSKHAGSRTACAVQ